MKSPQGALLNLGVIVFGRGTMRIAAIVSNALILLFVGWMDVGSVRFALSVEMPLIQPIGVILGQWIFIGLTVIPTLVALLQVRPRVESYAILANRVLWWVFAAGMALLFFAVFLPGTDYRLVLLAAIPEAALLLSTTFSLVALRRRREKLKN
jgi:magnesium-transporting ATPase (P-type)